MTVTPDQRLPDMVDKAREKFRDVITKRLQQYAERRKTRKLKVAAFLGPGRAGKDEAANWLRTNFDVAYSGSVSEFVCPLIAYSLGKSESAVYKSRHQDRMFWFEYCNELRRYDPAFLVKMCLANGDIIAGIRAAAELEACVSEGVIDVTFWVDNPRVDPDPTLEYCIDDCDYVIRNATHKLDYYRRLRKLAGMLGFTPRKGHFAVGVTDGQKDDEEYPSQTRTSEAQPEN